MESRFSVITTFQARLWDYGWFDLTRFRGGDPTRFRGSDPKRSVGSDPSQVQQGSRLVLAQFLSDPMAQKSFCSGGEWGEAIGRHGPFPATKLTDSWYQPVSCTELGRRIDRIFADEDFDGPPDAEQRRVVDVWVESVASSGGDVYALEAPDDSSCRVAFSHVWTLFHEFLVVNRSLDELTVAVIGYD